ncbi:MAG TPA: DCC1-like thiol-disulfide oxidoreductase family protein [Candidatus Sulfopaludibacter sp.]|nr:DCC1-like thiol-disulfide oxidoreductase family protein [Candidatus Sulfopaludibacter sp.]
MKVAGWVLYDANCNFCTRLAQRFQPLLARRHFELLPLQTPWVRARLGLADSRLLAEMRVLLPDGTNFGGADALIEISRRYWWAWPIRQMTRLPTVRELVRRGYRWVARRRNCARGICNITNLKVGGKSHRFLDFLPLLILPLLVLPSRNRFAAWIFMAMMAFALYAGCKWLTYRRGVWRGRPFNLLRALGYLLAWPGMDATRFLNEKAIPEKPRGIEWASAATKTAFGIGLLWGIARTVLPVHPILAGWIGMTGAIFILHFGLFHILSLIWRRAGVTAMPVMKNPLKATSLADFWGRRWNTAFNELAFRFSFRPICRLARPTTAMVLAFGLSGLVHESVISLPARGGYGLPTAYFLVQGLGLATERTSFGRRIGLGRGVLGWCFTLLVTAGPAFWLFHPWFIKNVILPMLSGIGAI